MYLDISTDISKVFYNYLSIDTYKKKISENLGTFQILKKKEKKKNGEIGKNKENKKKKRYKQEKCYILFIYFNT